MELKYINILLNIDEIYQPKVKYVFNTLSQILGLKPKYFTRLTSQQIHIYYGKRIEDEYPIHIYHNPDAVEFFSKKEQYPPEMVNLVKYGDEYIPFLFSKQGETFRFTSNSIRLRKDIISSAFFFLTCWQEYSLPGEISPNSPYDHSSSFQHCFGFSDIPPVDRYCELLEDTIKRAFPEFVKSNIWPTEKKFAVSLSHNLEYWNFWTNAYIDMILKRKIKLFKKKSLKAYTHGLMHKINKKFFSEPSRNIKYIIRREKFYKSTSSFFISTKTDFPDARRNYFGKEKIFNQLVKLLKDGSVNLQGSKEAGYQYNFLPAELDRLDGFSARGFRIRYLNFNYQNLFTVLEKAEINYDSSIGFDEHIGYRAGISFPFYPYNLKEDRPFDVLEIPIIAMDRSLMNQAGNNFDKARRRVENLLRKSKIHKSHISISWHTHLFDAVDFPRWGRLYWKLLAWSKHNSAWLCSFDKLYNYWENK